MLTLTDLFHALQIAVVSVTWTLILLQPGMLFERLGEFLFTSTFARRFEWVVKPLGACEKCFSGQLSLWSFLLINRADFVYLSTWPRLASFICASILATELAALVLHRLRR